MVVHKKVLIRRDVLTILMIIELVDVRIKAHTERDVKTLMMSRKVIKESWNEGSMSKRGLGLRLNLPVMTSMIGMRVISLSTC